MQQIRSSDIILKIFQYHFGGRKREEFDCIKRHIQSKLDLSELFSNKKTYDLVPFFYSIINRYEELKTIFPDRLLQNAKKAYYHQLACNLVLYDQLCVILNAANQEVRQILVLKGFALAEICYGDIAARLMADIDILVRKQDYIEIEKLISRMGYVKIAKPKFTGPISEHAFHIQFMKTTSVVPVLLEVHLGLSKKPYKFDMDGIWNRSQKAEFAGNIALVMEPTDLLIYLSFHAAGHNFKRLMWLCDIAQLLKKYKEKLNWDVIVQCTNSSKTNIALYYSLELTRHLFHISLPSWNPSDLRITGPAKAYLERHIKSHVFDDNSTADKDNFRAFLTRLSISDNKKDKFFLIKDYMQLLVFRDSDNLKQRYKIKSKASLAIIRIIFPFIVILRGLLAVIRTKKKTVSVW